MADFTVTIPDGETSGDTTFTLTPTDDEMVEGDETISVSGTTTVTGLTLTNTQITLEDDDGNAEVTIDDASAAEGDSITFTVTLDKAVQGGLTVTPSFADGTATKGTDYTENTAALTFAGTASEAQTIKVATTEDAQIEGNETFTVSLMVSGTTAPVTDTATATGTITNDDAASTGITISVSPTSVGEDDTATTVTVTAMLNDAVRSGATPVTVVVGAAADAATEGTDYATVADFTVTIPGGETSADTTFTLTPTDDSVVEGNETLSVSGTTTVTGLTVTNTEVTLTDDDGSAAVTIENAWANEGDSITFTVTLDKAVQGGLTVTPSFTNGTAASTDYTANTTALTFAGTASETETFKVATTEDAVIEGNETFTVGLAVAGTTAPVTDTDTATGTITNDDAASTGITLSVDPTSVAEDDTATTVTVTATLNDAVRSGATPVTVKVGAAGDAATEGTDYTAVADFTVTIPDGETSGDTTFTLTPTDDEVVEGDETLSVSGTTTVTGLTVTNTEVTLTDDDGSAAVTIENASANEGDSITFTVTLDKAVQGGLTVTPSFSGGTATEGTDYTVNTGALTFAGTSGETETIKVATTEDALIESDETFTVGLAVSGTSAPVTDTDTATGTITNDDAASTGITLSVSPDSVAEDAGATTVTVTATLNDAVRATATPVTVAVGASVDAATEGTDYTAVADFTVTIPAGETSGDTTFTLTPTDDEVVEGDETLSVSGTTTVTGLTVTNTEVTLTDDDGSAAVTVDDASANEGDSITFTVTLDKAVQGGLTVTPSFSGGTATSTDYTANTTALTFVGTASETQTFKVATTEDAVVEGNETFTVGLAVSGTSAPVTDTDTATGTITNDDAASTGIALSVSPAMVAEDDTATTVTVTATLNDAVRSGATPVTVVVGAAADAATEGTDYATVADFTVTIPDGETSADTTFTLTPTDDDVVEGDETLSVSGTTTVTGLTVTNTEVTLTDDDGSAAVTVDDASANEGDSITFTVTLDKAVQGGLTVTPSFSGGTATSTDYTANTTALTFAGTASETQTFKVATTEDAVIEGNETFTVGLAVSGTSAPVTDTDTATGTITNDDAASTGITISVSPSTVAENDTATTVTVTATLNDAVRSGATPVTVAVGATGDAATEGTDYAAVADFTVTIPDGETSGDATFTLTPTDDAVVEGDETLSVSGTTTVTGLTVTDTEVTLTDDDGRAEVTIGDASAPEGDSITFTVTLDKAVQGGLTVTPSFSGGTATEGTDYTANTTALTFAGTASETQTFKVATTEDALIETNETFTVSLTVTGTTAPVTDTDTATGTITNDDAASTGITISVSPDSVAEDAGATTVTVTATLNDAVRASATPVTVVVGATGDAATEGTDYTAVADFTVTIPDGETSGDTTFTLTPTDDEVVEGDETLSVSGTTTVTGFTVTNTAVTLTDDDGSAAVTIENASANEGDSITFTVTLDKAVQGGLTVTPSFTDGTATAGTDYTANTTALTFAGAASETQTFKVATTEDAVVEGNETFTVGLAVSGTSAPVTATDTATGTITNDDAASTGITLSVSPDSVAEDAGATTVTVTATLNDAVRSGATPVTVAVGVTGDAATEGTDYTAVADFTVTIPDGETSGDTTFTLTPTDDEVVEGDETLSVSGTTTVTGFTVTNTAVTLTDDDGSAAVTIENASANEGDSITFTVTLDKAVQGGLTVTPSFTDGTATAGTDYTANTTALTFAGAASETQTFKVATTEDAVVEGNETFTVGLAVSGTSAPVTATDTATGTITNDDAASTGITLSVSPDSVAEDAGATTVTVTATLNDAVRSGATPVTVAVGVTGDAATEGTDYTAVADFTVTIPDGETSGDTTFTLTPTDDDVVEGDETLSVSGTTTVTGLTVTNTEVTLTDDDGSAEVTIDDASAAEGDSITFTVTLDKAVQGGLTVTPSFTDGTATSADYTANTTALTFAGTASETQTFKVATTEDAVIEGNETFTVGLAVSGTSAPVTDTDTATGTITNDDAASTGITLSVSPDSVAEDAGATTVTVTATLNDAVRSGATPVTVVVGAAADAATEGTDYAAVADFTVTIPDGETSADTTFTLTPTDDEVVEGDETLSVSGTTTVTGLTVTDTELTLTDDDGSAEVTIDDASAAEGDSITFTVTLDKAVQGGLTVTPSFSGGTAASTDYTANTTALTFTGTASETQSFKVATTEDAVVENDETFTVSLSVSGTTAPVTDTDTATGTITNDDAASTAITLSVSPSTVDEDAGATTVTVTATLNDAVRTAATPVTVAVGATDDDATEGTDYAVVADFTVTIPDGETSGDTTFTLTPTDDSVVEGDETLSVSGTTTVTELTVINTTVTLNDDDGGATVTIGDASAAEGDTITFTVTLDKAVQGGLTVTPSFADGTATKGTDYTENTASLTFTGNAGETSTLKVATTEDAAVESNETFTVSLAVSGTTVSVTATDTGTGSITDDDGSAGVTLTVNPTSVAEDAGATTVTVTATMTGGTRADSTALTVAVGAVGDGATEGTDYATVGDFTVTIPAGSTRARGTFTLTPTADSAVEGDETLSISGDATVERLAVSGATVTITDGDASSGRTVPALTIDDATAAEGDSLAFTVTLRLAVSGGLTVTPSFTDGTATSGTDYSENTAALTFTGTAGETQTFKVATGEDAVVEADETFTVGLSVSGTTATVTATDTGTGTITDDDGSAAVTIDNTSANEGDTITFTVTLDKAVQGGLTVTPGFTDGTATSGTDYTANTTALTFAGTASETQTIKVATTEDAVVETNETFTVSLSVSGTTAPVTATDTGTGTITNDDAASTGITLSVSPNLVAEDAGATTVTVTATLNDASRTSATPITVAVGASTDAATEGTDYATVNDLSMSIPAGNTADTATFTLTPTDDSVVEGDETLSVAGTTTVTGLDVTNTELTLTDDDGSAAVTIGDASAVEGDAITFTVTLDKAVQGGLTVTPSFTDGTATSGTDYTENTAALTFAGNAGETATFEVATTEDAVVESNETFTVSLAVAGTTVSATATDTGTGTILDDDGSTAVTLAVNPTTVAENAGATTVTVTATMTGGTRADSTEVTVAVGASGDGATEGTDYATVSDLSVTIPAGSTRAQETFTLTPTDDAVVEGDETLSVSGSASGLGVTGATVTIEDDDNVLHTEPELIIDGGYREGGETRVGEVTAGEGDTLTFTVTLDRAVSGGLTVTPSFTDGTATSVTDYTENTAALTFTGTAGETHTFAVATRDDAVVEADEIFTVSLSVSGTTETVRVSDMATGTITDNDGSAVVTIDNASANEGDTITFTVTLDKAVQGGLTVTPSFTDGTATEGTDYAENTAALTFAGAASETQTFTVATNDDAVVESDETFTVGLSVSGTTAPVTATDTGTGTITNDDTASTGITLSVSPTTVAEDAGATTVTVTATLNDASRTAATPITVAVGASTDAAAEGTDYATVADLTMSIPAGNTADTATFTLTPTDDSVVEGDETLSVAGTTTVTGLALTNTEVTLTDDDGSAGVTIGDASAVEGDAVTFTVTLDKAVQGGFTVTPSFTDGAAASGTDYTENTAALTFAGNAGETATFEVATTDDAVVESNETFTVSLDVSGTTVSVTHTDTGTGTILDDDGSAAVTLTVNPVTVAENAGATTVTVTATMTGGTRPDSTEVTVAVGASGDGATEGTDYTTVDDFTVTIPAGSTRAQGTFTLTPTDDSAVEGDEALSVSGSTTGLRTRGATVTITDDDGRSRTVPTLTVDDATAAEGDSLAFAVKLDQAVSGGLTVTPSFTDGTATSGTDYTGNTAALTFTGTEGETQTFKVATGDDTVVEADETFTVGLSVSGTTETVTATDTGTGTITNDDGSAAVTIDNASANEGDTITFTVTLDKAVQGGLTVTPSFADGTATSGTDYTANTTALTFAGTANETQTLKVATTEDAVVESNETFTVLLSVSGTSAPVTATDSGTGTITNDDTASTGITLSVSPTTVAEDAGATTVTVTATLNDASRTAATPITVAVGASTDAANEGTDYTTVADLSMSIPAGSTADTATFTLTPTDDAVVEDNETLSVSGTTTVTGLTMTNTEVTLTDDDGSAGVTIGDASAIEGDAITFTVTLDKAVQGGFTVTPSFTDGTATSGTDYTENTAALTFAGNAGETATFAVATTEDAVIESNETFTVSLDVSGTTVSVTHTDTGTGTILDDDGSAAVTLTVNPTAVAEDASATTVTVTATMTGGTRADSTEVTVAVGAADDGATEGTDYTAVDDFTVTIPAGSTRARSTFTLTPTNDDLVEGDETVSVSGSASGLGVTGATVTIEDDDVPQGHTDPELTFSGGDPGDGGTGLGAVTAAEGDTLTFTVTLDRAVSGGLTVTPSFTDGTATSAADYTENTAALTFAGTAGETHTFAVATKDDAVVEADETFTVSLSVSGTTATVKVSDTVTGTITDDDGSAAVTIDNASATEGDTLTFTVTLDKAVQGGLTVTPSFTDGTGTSGTDYTANTAALTFAGTASETQTLKVATTEDAVVETNETFTVSLSVSGTSAPVTATDTGAGTITNDDTASTGITLSVSPTTVAEDAGATTVTVTATLNDASRTSATPITVAVGASTDAATEGTDYATVNDLSMSIPAGNTADTATFTLTPTDDDVVEGAETLSVSGTTTVTGLAVTDTEITLTDDDGSAGVTIGDAASLEGDAITFTVTLDKAVQGGFTVTPSFTDATATSGTDYTENTATLTFAGNAGETRTLEVATTEDALVESNETFTVSLSVSGTTASVTATDTGTGTIVDDDGSAAVTLTVNPTSVAETAGATTVTVTATMTGGTRAASTEVTVAVGSSDDGATEGTDYTTVSDFTVTIPVGSTRAQDTFTLTPTDDTAVEGDETLSVSGSTTGLRTRGATVTITDDDGRSRTVPTLTINDAAAAEGDSLAFTVTLDQAVSGGLTVTPSFTDGTATSATDYTENTAALTFTGAEGETKTFKVATGEDAVVEADETFTVGLSVSGTTATVTATDTGTGTITDDDGTAAVTIENARPTRATRSRSPSRSTRPCRAG